ncbi:hypothetical protein AS156_35930 [Bradyrhizobium macuxiense]|uniref:Uncharacterized protein n=1 Tax=Bradyrhizobium macuxiense TaxID=1755647 RepID=A0A109K011_9BRAD|nr:hypothetical protein AS156_35930 [Bradyrhizobium macuxiense]
MQRPSRSHPSVFHHDKMISKAFDVSQIVADIDHRQRERFMHPLEERQNLLLGGAIEQGKRLIHHK